jgi:heme o synthase
VRTGLSSVKEGGMLLLELSKWRVSLFAGLCAACGYSMVMPYNGKALALIAGAVFMLSSGALILNQLQEKDRDALLERTRNRPVPSGRCSPQAALIISLIFITASLGIVISYYSMATFFACLFSLFFYNALYTPLKRVSHFAIIFGAFAGALPPLIGWLAAGRIIPDFEISALIFFLYLWQFPHFWLHCLYSRNDYENNDIHSIASVFSDNQLRRIILIWTLAMGVASLFLTLCTIERWALSAVLLAITVISIGKTVKTLLWERGEKQLRAAFALSMYYGIIIVFLLIINQVVRNLSEIQLAS